MAQWSIAADAAPQPYRLELRSGERTFVHPLLVGQRAYYDPVVWHDAAGPWVSEVRLRPIKLFGVVPGLDAAQVPWLRNASWLALPPWIVAYLLITIPITYGAKSLLHIY
jgi:hypothetical protein